MFKKNFKHINEFLSPNPLNLNKTYSVLTDNKEKMFFFMINFISSAITGVIH